MAVELWRTRPYTRGAPIAQAVDRLFEQAFGPLYAVNGSSSSSSSTSNGGSNGYRTLPVNVWETDEAYHAAMLAPGIDEQSISVTVHEDTLIVEGELRFGQAPEGARTVWQEFGPSKFRRSLRLGSAVDATRVEALYRGGVLLVTLPRAEHARPRQVPVQMATAAEK